MTEKDAVTVLAFHHFGYRKRLCVPNTTEFVPWEADLLAMTPAGYLDEVEVKLSQHDFMRDFTSKPGKHKVLSCAVGTVRNEKSRERAIARFWFAVPEEMRDFALQNLPQYAGLLVIRVHKGRYWRVDVAVEAPRRVWLRPLSTEERYNLARLGAMRLWTVLRRNMK